MEGFSVNLRPSELTIFYLWFLICSSFNHSLILHLINHFFFLTLHFCLLCEFSFLLWKPFHSGLFHGSDLITYTESVLLTINNSKIFQFSFLKTANLQILNHIAWKPRIFRCVSISSTYVNESIHPSVHDIFRFPLCWYLLTVREPKNFIYVFWKLWQRPFHLA